MIDQRLLGQGAQAVETGKVDRFRLTQAGEGAAIAQVYGRMRVGGQVIWASDFAETTTVTGGGGGKGATILPPLSGTRYSVPSLCWANRWLWRAADHPDAPGNRLSHFDRRRPDSPTNFRDRPIFERGA